MFHIFFNYLARSTYSFLFCWIAIKHDSRNSMNERNTSLQKKSLILFSKGSHSLLVEGHILREGTYCPIPSSGSQGLPTLAPPCQSYRQRRPNTSALLHVLGSTLDSLALSKSECVVSFRLHTCWTWLFWRSAIPLFLITTWQLAKAHGVTRNEPKIHFICYITLFAFFQFYSVVTGAAKSTILQVLFFVDYYNV